jgi:hypothetical protein
MIPFALLFDLFFRLPNSEFHLQEQNSRHFNAQTGPVGSSRNKDGPLFSGIPTKGRI